MFDSGRDLALEQIDQFTGLPDRQVLGSLSAELLSQQAWEINVMAVGDGQDGLHLASVSAHNSCNEFG